MTEEVKLKPCPACGNNNPRVSTCSRVSRVVCGNNDTCGFEALSPTDEMTIPEAIAAWNHRPLEDAKDARIAELEARNKELELRDGDATHMLMDMELKKHEMSLYIFDLERQLAEATQWRSPETAPRDKYFLALMYGRQPCVIARNAADTLWVCLYSAITFEDDEGPHFTGWLPLPETKKEDV